VWSSFALFWIAESIQEILQRDSDPDGIEGIAIYSVSCFCLSEVDGLTSETINSE
jgi:hypothetical protein